MRAAVYRSNDDVRVEEMPTPKIGAGELLVKVMASGICGSDVMEWYRAAKAPCVLGHEIAGEIVDAGADVDAYQAGDRVFVSHHVPCNTCRHCLAGHHTTCETLRTTDYDPGGFAEYIRVPRINVDRGVFVLPDEMSYEDATFIEPLGCVLRAQRAAGLRPGSTVLVIGSGISGLLHVKLAVALDAGRVIATDLNRYRLDAASRFGAEAVISAGEDVPARVRELNEGYLADYVITCTAATSAIETALRCVGRGGTVVFFAPTEPGVDIEVPMGELWPKQVKLMTSYAAAPADLSAAIELIRAGRVEVGDMITHRLGLDEIGEGFRLTAEAAESLKVIIEPQR